MATYISSKKYPGVQYYIKDNGVKSYSIRYKDESGKLKRVQVGDESDGTTEVYCKNKRIEILNAQNKGEQPPKIVKNHRKKIITLDDVADKYFSSMDNTTSTHERLSKYNKHLSEQFGRHSITNIKKTDLEDLQKSIIDDKKLSKKTANMILELFSTIFRFGFNEELYEAVNPAMKVKRFKVKNTRERFLRVSEIEELYKQAILKDEEKDHGDLLEVFVKLALTTGARLEGILNIKKRDIDLESDIIRITDFKNGGEIYSGYVTKTTRDLLTNKLNLLNYNDNLVSFNNDGKQISARQIQTRLKPILDDLFNVGLDTKDRANRIVIHSLRHTFASQLAISNVPIRQIQELMNHADIRETMKYAKLQDDANKKAAQSVF
ncbi:tyrosine-type recombinase/integrase [Candidatus Sulfurimonas baltica]|uniref:Site-specific integrase n=1 Tax=Candidatus Sulfurimonas baltica TaxID=2740404 RepID=A0A7S7LUP2_9BACT|nr:site-specific integrase [Candidatus Sulfurimonas baltica]QOY51816.1 site-specific integrase [Candidatus Sulfurimonas baltica]